MRWAMLVVAVLAGCGAYKVASSPQTASASNSSDTFTDTTARMEVGCVEVGVDRRADRELSPVVRYAVENHCAESVTVDLAWANVIGRTADGAEIALVPSSEASHATIVPSGSHVATIAYRSDASIGQLCVDVASIATTPEAIKTQWRCFGNVISVTMR